MAANIIQTKQDEFATSMLQKLKEEKGSLLIDFSEKASGVKGANTYTFYRMGESGVGSNELNMFADEYTGTGGTAEKVTATIDYIYAHDKIRAADINSTSLDLESTFIKSLSDALKRNVDKTIIAAIAAKTDSLVKMGDISKAVEDAENVDALLEATSYASTLVKDTSVSEGRMGVALVLDAVEFSKLHRAEKTLNADYRLANTLLDRNVLFSCDVVKVAQGAKDKQKMYIIPAGTFGTASWENDVEAKAWYEDGQDALFCRAKRSLGVAVLEPESIIEFSHL